MPTFVISACICARQRFAAQQRKYSGGLRYQTKPSGRWRSKHWQVLLWPKKNDSILFFSGLFWTTQAWTTVNTVILVSMTNLLLFLLLLLFSDWRHFLRSLSRLNVTSHLLVIKLQQQLYIHTYPLTQQNIWCFHFFLAAIVQQSEETCLLLLRSKVKIGVFLEDAQQRVFYFNT